MGRNLVICCDGTNNEFGGDKTNVARLRKVVLYNSDQLVYYDPGVGTLPEPTILNKIWQNFRKLVSLAFGFGLTVNVQEAYSYLMNHWEDGDRVFLFGFSRGAYTVRVLAGLLHVIGLLPPGNENLVPYLMRLYGGIREQRRGDNKEGNSKYWKLCNAFRGTFARSIAGLNSRRFPIHFMGVWDTVSSVGWIWEPHTYPYTAANPSVRKIHHAIAIDERRWFFRQNTFKGGVENQDLEELWFPGVHADVGGGYADDEGGLWRVAFEWMLDEARSAGLLIDPDRLKAALDKAPTDRAWAEKKHESLTWKWWPAEFFPKLSYRRESGRRLPQLGLGGSRVVEEGSRIGKAALLRIREPGLDYNPPNLSASFLDMVRGLPTVPENLPYKR